MKKLTVALLGVLLCQSAMASVKLPFVGKRSLLFSDYDGAVQDITISK